MICITCMFVFSICLVVFLNGIGFDAVEYQYSQRNKKQSML